MVEAMTAQDDAERRALNAARGLASLALDEAMRDMLIGDRRWRDMTPHNRWRWAVIGVRYASSRETHEQWT